MHLIINDMFPFLLSYLVKCNRHMNLFIIYNLKQLATRNSFNYL